MNLKIAQTKKEKFLKELHDVNQTLREAFSKECADFVERNPSMTYDEITKLIGISHAELVAHCQKHNVWRKRGKGSSSYRGNHGQ